MYDVALHGLASMNISKMQIQSAVHLYNNDAHNNAITELQKVPIWNIHRSTLLQSLAVRDGKCNSCCRICSLHTSVTVTASKLSRSKCSQNMGRDTVHLALLYRSF